MKFLKKMLLTGTLSLFSIIVPITAYAYELIDKDGDGITETVRFCDGYEKEALFDYIGILAGDLAEGNYSNGIIHYDWLERDDEICRKYPGELRLAEEYLAKSAPWDAENNNLIQDIVQESSSTANTFEEKIEALQNNIHSRCKNIDENATGFTKEYSDVEEKHYRNYLVQKHNYERAIEQNAFLKGTFPLKEADYFKAAGDIFRNGLYAIGKPDTRLHFDDIALYRIGNEWYQINGYWYEQGDATVVKGIREDAIQELLRSSPQEWLWGSMAKMSITPSLKYLPETVKERLRRKWLETGYHFPY